MTDAAQPVTEATPPPAAQTESAPAPVPYERFKEVNETNKALSAKLAEYETRQKAAEETQLAEQNKWKELFEKTQGELKSERAQNLRLKVASSKGLPSELIDRLRGETEEELVKDAEGLLSFLKPTQPQGSVPPPPKGGTSNNFDFQNSTPEQIREYIKNQK